MVDRDERGLIEWLIARIAEHTGLAEEEIDPDAPFVEHGLSSRDAVTLSGEMEDALGCRLSPTLLWEHPTIRGLARHLATEGGAA